MGALLCSHMSNQMIDMDLVDDIVMAIPEDAWDKVKDTAVGPLLAFVLLNW